MKLAPYTPGQPVARIAFTDCLGRVHARVDGLTVASVKLQVCLSIPSYWRIVAIGEPTLPHGGGMPRYEGGTRYFEPAP